MSPGTTAASNSSRVMPEWVAATIFSMLGIPRDATWMDMEGRPHQIYHARPIEGLL